MLVMKVVPFKVDPSSSLKDLFSTARHDLDVLERVCSPGVTAYVAKTMAGTTVGDFFAGIGASETADAMLAAEMSRRLGHPVPGMRWLWAIDSDASCQGLLF